MRTGGIEELQQFAKKQIEAHRLKDNFYAVDIGRLYRLHAVRTKTFECENQVIKTLNACLFLL
jgi:hypothetical protein